MSVLITGAAGAVGSACVDFFVERGHAVIAHDLELTPRPVMGSVTWVSGDLSDESTLASLAAASEASGLRAVVVAHGIDGTGPLSEFTENFARLVLWSNWTSVHRIFECLRPLLSARHGTFLALIFRSNLTEGSGDALHGAAASAVAGWVEAQAALDKDVDVRALEVGNTKSARLLASLVMQSRRTGVPLDQIDQQLTAAIPLGRYAEAREVAAAAYFLAGNDRLPRKWAVTGGSRHVGPR